MRTRKLRLTNTLESPFLSRSLNKLLVILFLRMPGAARQVVRLGALQDGCQPVCLNCDCLRHETARLEHGRGACICQGAVA